VTVRGRTIRAVVGLLLFAVLAWFYDPRFWDQPWFFIAIGLAASTAFVEHFFTRPQDSAVNALAAVGALAASSTVPMSLRVATGLVVLITLLASLVAMLLPEPAGPVKRLAYRVSIFLGRAVVLGGLLLLSYVLAATHSDHPRFEALAVSTALLLLVLAVDWSEVVRTVTASTGESATALAAIGPHRLLLSSPGGLFHEGEAVSVSRHGREVAGYVAVRLPHKDDIRYEVVLDEDWASISRSFPSEVQIRRDKSPDRRMAIGAADEGSTATSVEFVPFVRLGVGDPLMLHAEGRQLLYQVSALRLRGSTWAGASALVSQASARRIGWPSRGFIRSHSYLPDAHQPLYRFDATENALPDGFQRIGVVKGTNLPIGLSIQEERRGHTAVLGMSGMGKTAVAFRIATALGASHLVIALDTTGEYSARLGAALWNREFAATGLSVYEPAGDPPRSAAELIGQCMDIAAEEYRSNTLTLPRVVLLEEAHTFVPEWNFALRDQQEQASRTTRLIMQSRKYRVSFIVVSQRTAVVSKSALSQCENYLVLRTIDETSLDYIESVVGKQLRDAIPALSRFEALCVGPLFNTEEPVIVTLDPPAERADPTANVQ
jgi:hypothetical protein